MTSERQRDRDRSTAATVNPSSVFSTPSTVVDSRSTALARAISAVSIEITWSAEPSQKSWPSAFS